jgi:hypothetical protein
VIEAYLGKHGKDAFHAVAGSSYCGYGKVGTKVCIDQVGEGERVGLFGPNGHGKRLY